MLEKIEGPPVAGRRAPKEFIEAGTLREADNTPGLVADQSLASRQRQSAGSFFALLGDGWALGADINQWIVLRAKNRRYGCGWQPVAYVGGQKATLITVLREKRAVVDARGQAVLAALPESFLEWRDRRPTSGG